MITIIKLFQKIVLKVCVCGVDITMEKATNVSSSEYNGAIERKGQEEEPGITA